jgi:hypothetical protein
VLLAEVSATMRPFRPIHPQIPPSKFAPKKAWISRLRETIGADPGGPKIKIDATTIAPEASDAATHRAKAIGPQAIAAITNVETTTVR